ncbi:MAG: adenosylhomocysteinase [Dictyoglomus sp.]|jgi:adenosylhomocysteinase|uniref:adenosylhomocysteinase n=1 Tax=Dictyoglomus sp. TaxID=28205 RepID=UPI000CCF6D29|nr:MAG: adenosylhomocysteinase [Dictyoglomus turgidum]
MSRIRDINLWESGKKKIEWVKNFMPVVNTLESKYSFSQIFKDKTIGMCIHLEAKTARLALAFKNCGAKVVCAGSNPLSTQDDVAAYLVKEGIEVFAWRGESSEDYERNLEEVLKKEPNLIIDDGFDLTVLLYKKFSYLKHKIFGVGEETTTGVKRAKALLKDRGLDFPVVAVNDSKLKFLFDNRYGTGESAISSFMRNTNLLISGRTFVVAGYGWVGRGIAQKLQGLKAKVIITEVDPIKALEAHMDGFLVMPMKEAVKIGDVFITATGNFKVIGEEYFYDLKDGAILANAGHFNVEIDMETLEKIAIEKREVRDNIHEYKLPNGKRVFVIAEGRLLNLAGGDGHPIEIMDLSFGIQFLVMKWLMERGKELPKGVISVSEDIELEIAKIKLDSLGISIDTLTPEQLNYLQSWE